MTPSSLVKFLNQPKLSENKTDQQQNERRIALISQIEEYLTNSEYFKGYQVTVNFFDTGTSCLVSLLETMEHKYVLKVLLRPDGPKGEEVFLKAWENIGISVPHVYESGMIGKHHYILMKYVPAESLYQQSEDVLVSQKIFEQVGKILRKIHGVPAVGYGNFTEDGCGEYVDFKSWLLEFPQTKKQIEYVQENNVLPSEEFGSIDQALNILITRIGPATQSVYCHWDFAPGNILHTNPLTVFDPVPVFNHPYLDIARSIIQTIGNGFTSKEIFNQLLNGYFENIELLDQEFLSAAILFIAYTKIAYWHRVNKLNAVRDIQSYLIENRKI